MPKNLKLNIIIVIIHLIDFFFFFDEIFQILQNRYPVSRFLKKIFISSQNKFKMS